MTNNCDNSFELDLFIPNKKPKETTSSHCICDGDYLNNIFTANQAKNEIDEEENYEESYQKRTTAVSDSHKGYCQSAEHNVCCRHNGNTHL